MPASPGNAVTVACLRNWTTPETAIVASATHASVAARMRPHDLLGGSATAAVPAAPADAAGLFGAPPADADEVAQLKQRIAELEASDASEALAARVAESAQLQRRVQALEEENTNATSALAEANERLQTERAARKANEATLLDRSDLVFIDPVTTYIEHCLESNNHSWGKYGHVRWAMDVKRGNACRM